MSTNLLLVLALLAAAIVMFALNRPRMDVVGLLMLTVLPLTGVITMGEALAGFSDSNIVLIAALFVIGDGLVRTGVARSLGDLLIAKTGKSETKLVTLLMVCVCALGSLMSSTAVTAIFIPVALRVSERAGASPGRLMMPLSVAALISGMMTLVATAPNLVVNSELVRQGVKGFRFFAFTPFGVPILLAGIAYILFVRRWLPGDPSGTKDGPARASLADWIEEFGLASREVCLEVQEGSPLVAKELAELNLRKTHGVNIIAVERAGRFSREMIQPTWKTVLEPGDILLLDRVSQESELDILCEQLGLAPLQVAGEYFNDRSQEIGMAQVIIPTESELIGKTVVDSGFRTRTGLTVIGFRRGQESFGSDRLEMPLKVSDTLLLVGTWKNIERLRVEDVGVLLLRLPIEVAEVLQAPGKAPHALVSLGLVVIAMVTGVIPNVQAALLGCLLMGLLGCVDMTSSYRAISWKTILLIVGMMPFSVALQRTGGVALAAEGLVALTDGAGARVVLGALFAITTVLGMFMSNTATAVLMAPVAIAVAKEMNASPYPFAMIVALAASTAFVTPVSSPVNMLVMTPGNYKFGDFVRIGGPFAVLVMIVCLVLVPLLLPL